jgi:hypothetical protein
MLLPIALSAAFTAVVLMLAFPCTPTGRAIHRCLVVAPARFLLDLTWTRLGQIALSAAAFGLMLFMAPEMLMALAAMGADATLLEFLILAWLASVSGRLAAAWRSLRRVCATMGRLGARFRTRANRSRSPRPRRQSRPPGKKMMMQSRNGPSPSPPPPCVTGQGS